MSHHSNIRTLATQAFVTAWADRMPLLYPNDGRKKPSVAPWGRFTIIQGTTVNAAMTGLLQRTPVVFGVQIHMEMHQGIKEAYESADALATLENQNFLSDDGLTTLKTKRVTLQDGGIADGYKVFSISVDAIGDS